MVPELGNDHFVVRKAFQAKNSRIAEQNCARGKQQIRITCYQEVALLVASILTMSVSPVDLQRDFK